MAGPGKAKFSLKNLRAAGDTVTQLSAREVSQRATASGVKQKAKGLISTLEKTSKAKLASPLGGSIVGGVPMYQIKLAKKAGKNESGEKVVVRARKQGSFRSNSALDGDKRHILQCHLEAFLKDLATPKKEL